MNDDDARKAGSLRRPSNPSGQHPAVAAFRAKADSIVETTIPLLTALEERIDRARSAPPKSLEGDWGISIRGLGPLPPDANRITAKFVQELRLAGHVISRATITQGENVMNEVARTDLSPHPPKETP